MLLSIFCFLFGLLLIYFSSNWLIDVSEKLGEIFKLPEILIGFLMLGFGTSAPEIAISWYSAYIGNSSMLFGNIAGSNIMNVLLVFGLALAIKPISFHKPKIQTTVIFSILTILFCLGIYLNYFSRIIGLILLVLGCYNIYSSFAQDQENELVRSRKNGKLKYSLLVLINLIFIIISSKIIVSSGIEIADHFGINQGFFAMSFVAFGTSLPELVLSLIAASKNRGGLIVGNIIGSNICNISFALGIAAIIKPFSVNDSDALYIMGVLILSTIMFLLSCYIRYFEKRLYGFLYLITFILSYIELFMLG